MSNEDKAKELVQKFTDTIFDSGNTVSKPMIKAVCLICVEEILKHIQRRVTDLHDMADISDLKEWQSVKEQISKL